ncbi:MAG: hypothetical protein ABI400_12030, partial [Lacisediminihabitans sp.]
MNKIISRGLWGVLFLAGLSVLGTTAANAAETNGGGGTASGTQGIVSLSAPISVGGNAISLLGNSSSSNAPSTTAPVAAPAETSASSTSGRTSLVGGTQALINAIAPVSVGGNAISVLGDSSSQGSSSG